MPTSSALEAFAEAPAPRLPRAAGERTAGGDGWHGVVSPDGGELFVSGLTLDVDRVDKVWANAHGAAPGATVLWSVGPSSRPLDLVERLLALGAHRQVTLTALAADREPPSSPLELDVRRIETFADFELALVVQADAAEGQESLLVRPDRAHETFERRQARPGGEWLAFLDGEPVACGGAVAGPDGLFLVGGATRPTARGRGCYRALVRVRWDYAVALGTPALAVHALETSRPILERLGFSRVGTLDWLVSGAG